MELHTSKLQTPLQSKGDKSTFPECWQGWKEERKGRGLAHRGLKVPTDSRFREQHSLGRHVTAMPNFPDFAFAKKIPPKLRCKVWSPHAAVSSLPPSLFSASCLFRTGTTFSSSARTAPSTPRLSGGSWGFGGLPQHKQQQPSKRLSARSCSEGSFRFPPPPSPHPSLQHPPGSWLKTVFGFFRCVGGIYLTYSPPPPTHTSLAVEVPDFMAMEVNLTVESSAIIWL